MKLGVGGGKRSTPGMVGEYCIVFENTRELEVGCSGRRRPRGEGLLHNDVCDISRKKNNGESDIYCDPASSGIAETGEFPVC